MARRTSLRASDADRDRVAERLRQASAEGRLLAHELEDRLATALRAQTYGELDAVVADLPGSAAVRPSRARSRSRARELVRHQPAAALALALAVTVVCAVVAAAVLAFSGIWLAFVVLMFVRRGCLPGRYAHRGHRF